MGRLIHSHDSTVAWSTRQRSVCRQTTLQTATELTFQTHRLTTSVPEPYLIKLHPGYTEAVGEVACYLSVLLSGPSLLLPRDGIYLLVGRHHASSCPVAFIRRSLIGPDHRYMQRRLNARYGIISPRPVECITPAFWHPFPHREGCRPALWNT